MVGKSEPQDYTSRSLWRLRQLAIPAFWVLMALVVVATAYVTVTQDNIWDNCNDNLTQAAEAVALNDCWRSTHNTAIMAKLGALAAALYAIAMRVLLFVRKMCNARWSTRPNKDKLHIRADVVLYGALAAGYIGAAVWFLPLVS